MITPAVLISASGTLVLSTSNRLTRVVDRVRSLARSFRPITPRTDRFELAAVHQKPSSRHERT